MRIAVCAALFAAAIVGQERPKIAAIVSAADFKPGVTVDGMVTIFGTNLADKIYHASTIPLPKAMGSVEVLHCNPGVMLDTCLPIDLIYVSPTQINAVLRPSRIGGQHGAVFVRRDGWPPTSGEALAASVQISFSAPQPRIFEMGYDCGIDPRRPDRSPCGIGPRVAESQPLRGAITDQRGVLVSAANPVRVGMVYTAWLTGLLTGPDGKASDVQLRFDDVPAYGYPRPTWLSHSALYAGRSPEFPGLHQVNFELPANFMGPLGSTYPAHPCGSYKWELTLTINQRNLGTPNAVQIPVEVRSGDVKCAP